MASKKKKDSLPAIQTTEQLHQTVDDIARLEVALRAKVAKRDAAIQLVRIEHDDQIEADKDRLKSLMKLAGTYATVHRESLFFSGLKSAASALARFGFRNGNPAIKPLNKKWTMETIMAKLREVGKFIRTVDEIDKEAIHAADLTDVQLAELGIRIDSGETFFVEPKGDDAGRIKAEVETAE